MADIDKITSRPSEYLAETGVPLLVGGLIFCLFGCSDLIQQVPPLGLIAQEIGGWIAICCAGAAMLGARTLKRRIVFPRGGYVEPRLNPALRFISVATLVALAALAIFEMAWPGRLPHLPHLERRLIEPGLAIYGGILCLLSGWQGKNTSRMWFGVYLVGLAPLLWMPERGMERMAWLEVGLGTPVAVAGAIRLRRFIKANPRPVETTNE